MCQVGKSMKQGSKLIRVWSRFNLFVLVLLCSSSNSGCYFSQSLLLGLGETRTTCKPVKREISFRTSVRWISLNITWSTWFMFYQTVFNHNIKVKGVLQQVILTTPELKYVFDAGESMMDWSVLDRHADVISRQVICVSINLTTVEPRVIKLFPGHVVYFFEVTY